MLEYPGVCHSHGAKHWSPCRVFSQLQPQNSEVVKPCALAANMVFNVCLGSTACSPTRATNGYTWSRLLCGVAFGWWSLLIWPSHQWGIPIASAGSSVSPMNYFLEVIRFSNIVGLVIQELYRPSQIDLSPEQMLHAASALDQRLTGWKVTLPRHLRFDLGHTFEKSIILKQQVRCILV